MCYHRFLSFFVQEKRLVKPNWEAWLHTAPHWVLFIQNRKQKKSSLLKGGIWSGVETVERQESKISSKWKREKLDAEQNEFGCKKDCSSGDKQTAILHRGPKATHKSVYFKSSYYKSSSKSGCVMHTVNTSSCCPWPFPPYPEAELHYHLFLLLNISTLGFGG